MKQSSAISEAWLSKINKYRHHHQLIGWRHRIVMAAASARIGLRWRHVVIRPGAIGNVG